MCTYNVAIEVEVWTDFLQESLKKFDIYEFVVALIEGAIRIQASVL